MSRYRYRSNKSSLSFWPVALLVVLALYILQKVSEFLSDNEWIFAILIFLAISVFTVVIVTKIIKSRYTELATHQSPAIRTLENLNSQYQFEEITISDLYQDYDNENFYDDISPTDYLTYQLVYMQKQVNANIDAAHKNSLIHPAYCKEVEALRSQFYDYLPDNILFKDTFKKIHRQIFDNCIQSPVTKFEITVTLCLTKINGAYITSKKKTFDVSEVKDIIKRLRHKQNDFYLDNEIWQSICRVERGKITNKIRFAVYAKDGNRCRQCGSTYDLEIDHIFPISKGGKSTYDNLQTLCHRCNAKKSDSVTADSISHYAQTHNNAKNICPQCKRGLLVIRNGKNGKFYGCSAYPNCKFTKNL